MMKFLTDLFGKKPEPAPAPAPAAPAAPAPKAPDLTPCAQHFAKLGARHGWVAEQEQRNIGLLILTTKHPVHGPCQMNIYYTKMTVATSLRHPRQGHTQQFRRNVSERELEQMMVNPRVHLGRGYQEK